MNFIKGNWYKYNDDYYKFDKVDRGIYYFCEEIRDKIWGPTAIWTEREVADGFLEKSILEIQEYLPDNHQDKLQASNIKNDLTHLIKLLNEIR